MLALAALAASVGCARARRTPPATDSVAFDRPHETTIGRAALAETADHEGETGVHLLASGLDAFAARVVLIDAAEEAIDVQYYIFRGDDSGLSLLVRLLAAADRGVRVRLLLDDVGAGALDETLAALATHPGIDVRLFNPIERGLFTRVRSWLDLAARAFELNHRMHNKMLAVDGAAAIVGGRNVGDEYFDAGSGANFADLDLLAVGAVLGELGESFDRYWSSTYAVPVDSWRSVRAEPGDLEAVRAELDEHERLQADSSYLQRVRSTELVEDLRRGSLPLIWADAHAVSDHPSKIEAGPDELEETLLTSQLAEHFAEPQRDVLVVSPYFVPGDAGVQRLCDAAGRGVRVRVLTNSLAATDVAAVHAGYAPYREPLLECGVDLYELKHTGELHRQAERAGVFGSASASLHAKTFLVDESPGVRRLAQRGPALHRAEHRARSRRRERGAGRAAGRPGGDRAGARAQLEARARGRRDRVARERRWCCRAGSPRSPGPPGGCAAGCGCWACCRSRDSCRRPAGVRRLGRPIRPFAGGGKPLPYTACGRTPRKG